LIAADIIIELIDFLGRPIVLIEHATMVEAQEEISLNVHMIALLGSYFDPFP